MRRQMDVVHKIVIIAVLYPGAWVEMNSCGEIIFPTQYAMNVSAVVVIFFENPATFEPIKLSIRAVAAGAVSSNQAPTIRTHVLESGIAARKMQPMRVGTLIVNMINVRPLGINELARPAMIIETTSTPPDGIVRRVVFSPVKPCNMLVSPGLR